MQELGTKIKEEAKRLGFIATGISKAALLEEEREYLRKWLDNEQHAGMGYMANHFQKRTDPRFLVDDARAVISVLMPYRPSKEQKDKSYLISKYAFGKDYHRVFKDRLFQLFDFVKKLAPEAKGRVFVDSAPVMDKVWAARSGLGWMGKNTNLLSKQFGSFFFVGELIVNLELEQDEPVTDYCGNCTRCVDACPTNALAPYRLDAGRCISYLTIEHQGKIPDEFKGSWEKWIFGCDICQDVCPWNKKAKITADPELKPLEVLLEMTGKDWEELTDKKFKELFGESALERTGYEGIMRNIHFLNDQEKK